MTSASTRLKRSADLHLVAVPQTVAIQTDAGLVGQVRGFDDQLVAEPPSARIAEVLPNRLIEVRPAIRVEDAWVVNHLVADRHHARRLHDAVAVAIDDTQHGADDAASDAAIVQQKSSGVLKGPSPNVPRSRGARRWLAAADRRLPAVRRIDDERGLAERTARVVATERADGVQRFWMPCCVCF